MTGLDLPALPSGWVYEGWAVIDGMPVTSGTFTMADMADNSSDPFAFKSLVGMAPADAADHTDYNMTSNVDESFPAGTVMRK